jgi:hypothetical protein
MTAARFEVFIYCDDPSHAPRREPVDVFVALPGGGWDERPPKKRQGRAGHVGAGMHMINDAPAATGWALDPEASNADVRTRFVLSCERTPACRRRPVPARQEHLFPVLDHWRTMGVSEVALAVIAANLQEQTERGPLD